MAKTKENIKDLKNIGSFGYDKLTIWGMVGALTILILSIVTTITWNIVVVGAIMRWTTFGIAILYAVLGVFALVLVVKKQEGNFWVLFLVASIFAILTPLTGIVGGAGIGLSTIAGILFLVYYLLEKK